MFFQNYCQTWRKTCKKQRREDDRQRGINPEKTDVDIVLADIIEKFEEAQKIHQDPCEKQEKNRERRSKSRRHAKKVIRDHWWNNEIKIGWKWWKTIKMQKYRLWNTEVFTGENRVRNCNMVARDWINKGRTYKQIRRSEKSNAL